MFQFLLLLASVFSLSGSFPPEDSARSSFYCDQEKNSGCIRDFDRSLGIPKVSSSVEFFKYINEYYKQHGKDGFAGVCSAGKKFEECEGDQFKDCTSVSGWNELGVSFKDAFVYASFTGQMIYECGHGYDAWYNNFDCIGRTYVSDRFNQTLAQCEKTLNDQVIGDPTKVCTHFQEFDECLTQPFLEACGRPVAHTYCSAMANGFKYMDGNCDKLHCDTFA